MIRSRKILTAPAVRIIPIVMMLALLLLAVRVYDIVIGGQALTSRLAVSNAYAAPPKEEMAAKEEMVSKEEMAETMDKKEMMMEDKGDSDKIDDVFATRGDVKANRPEESRIGQDRDFSPVEVDLLQSLASRREKLDMWEDEIALKENLLKATEIRVEDKLGELKQLQKKVEKLLEKYDVQEETEIDSLVKIYESMKPKNAAAIFNDLQMSILFKVIDGMSERRAAPILAAMDADKARALTQELAVQMQIRDQAKQAIQP